MMMKMSWTLLEKDLWKVLLYEIFDYLQLRAKQMAHLLHKHYQNEITLTGQNPPFKV